MAGAAVRACESGRPTLGREGTHVPAAETLEPGAAAAASGAAGPAGERSQKLLDEREAAAPGGEPGESGAPVADAPDDASEEEEEESEAGPLEDLEDMFEDLPDSSEQEQRLVWVRHPLPVCSQDSSSEPGRPDSCLAHLGRAVYLERHLERQTALKGSVQRVRGAKPSR